MKGFFGVPGVVRRRVPPGDQALPADRTVRRAAIAGLSVVLLLAGDALVWRIATGRLLASYERWRASLAAQGWRAESAAPVATGWPFAARVRLAGFSLTRDDGAGWHAQRMTFGVGLTRPHGIEVIPDGAQSLDLPGYGTQHFSAETWAVEVRPNQPVGAVQVRADRLAIAMREGQAVVRQAELTLDWRSDAAHLTLSAGPVDLPGGRSWGLGSTVSALSAELVAHRAWPPGPGRAAAQAWRAAGGWVDLPQVALRWGTLDFTGSGRAALDASLQPAARFDLRVVDPDAAVATLAQTGVLTRNEALAATAVLDLIGWPARLAGQPQILALPVELAHGTVSIGQIPVARVK